MEWWGASIARYSPYVQDYLDRVTAADVAAGNTQGLEPEVADRFSVAIEGLVANAMLGVSGGVISQAASKIKAMCFMCGARTLSGCLVPVVGPAPTNFNFVSGDYNRKTGLLGNGASKYLDSNRNNNLDPQDSKHVAAFCVGTWPIAIGIGCGPVTNEDGATNIGFNGTSAFARVNSRLGQNAFRLGTFSGFLGASRANNAQTSGRCNGFTSSVSQTSQTPFVGNLFVFSTTGGALPAPVRLSFYSIGESLDLAVLDACISTLMATLAAVIP
jgi:hypothetical protein